jgi:hypothetical protein
VPPPRRRLAAHPLAAGGGGGAVEVEVEVHRSRCYRGEGCGRRFGEAAGSGKD